VPLLAHELQHAVEVAQAPEVRDTRSVEQLFERLAITFGCGGTTCSETQAAKDVETKVSMELKAAGIGSASRKVRIRSEDHLLADLWVSHSQSSR
jgi:hypothetical protein